MARLALIVTLGLATWAPALMWGQADPPPTSGGQSLLYNAGDPDSVNVFWYSWSREKKLFQYIDTLPMEDLYIYEPEWDGKKPMANLGNTGTAVRSLWWEPSEEETGIRLGTRSWERYRWNFREFNYPLASKPYTRAAVVQGTSPINTAVERQQNGRFDLLFTRPFTERLQVFLDYRWLDFAGIYDRQRARVGKLATGLDFISRDSSYKLRFLVLMNAGNWEENGGITTDSLLLDTDPYRIRNNIPVNLESARTRLQERQFIVEQTFRFSENIPAIRLLSQYYTGYRKHTEGELDTLFYPESFRIDDRGLRRYGELTYLDNELFWPLLDGSLLGLTVGGSIRNAAFRTEVDRTSQRFTQLGASGDLRFSPDRFGLTARARIHWVDGSINYRLRSQLYYEPWKDIIFRGGFWLNRHRTAMMDTEYRYNDLVAFSREAEHTGASGLDFELDFEKWGLSARGRLANLRGQILFRPRPDAYERLDENIPIGQLSVAHEFRWGMLHWRNGGGFQALGNYSDELGLPDYYLTSTLRLEGYIFRRAMWMTTGFYLMYTPEFRSLGYFPMLGEWVQSPEAATIPAYPLVNYFFQFRVDRLQGFVLLENLYSFVSDTHWFTTPRYPMPDFGYRIGIMWHFRD